MKKCNVNMLTRKKCRKCRLDKCFQIGMQPTVKVAKGKSTPESILEQLVAQYIKTNLTQLDDSKVDDGTLASTSKLAKKRIARNLNVHELKSIQEVQNAMKVFIDEASVDNVVHADNLADVANVPEIYFNWIVSFCRSIPAYNQLNGNDQFIILKPFCFEMLAIRLSTVYDRQKKGFPMFTGNSLKQLRFIDLETTKNLQNRSELEENLEYAAALQDEMQNDLVIRDLV